MSVRSTALLSPNPQLSVTNNVSTIDEEKKAREHTDLSSASLAGLGHVPGSSVIALKKLYAHRPTVSANMRWVNEWDVSVDVMLSVDKKRGGDELTLNKTREPAIEDPNHRSEYNACKIGGLVDAIGIGVVVE
jgi:hypothetical protein